MVLLAGWWFLFGFVKGTDPVLWFTLLHCTRMLWRFGSWRKGGGAGLKHISRHKYFIWIVLSGSCGLEGRFGYQTLVLVRGTREAGAWDWDIFDFFGSLKDNNWILLLAI